MNADDLLQEEVALHFQDEAHKAKRVALPKIKIIGDQNIDYYGQTSSDRNQHYDEDESFGMTEFLHELGEIRRLKAEQKSRTNKSK